MPDTVRVGLIGSGFITSIHYEALRRVAGAEVVAVASPTPGRAERFAEGPDGPGLQHCRGSETR